MDRAQKSDQRSTPLIEWGEQTLHGGIHVAAPGWPGPHETREGGGGKTKVAVRLYYMGEIETGTERDFALVAHLIDALTLNRIDIGGARG